MVNPSDIDKIEALLSIRGSPDLGDIMNCTIETLVNPRRLAGFTFHKPDAGFFDSFPDVVDSTIMMTAGTVNSLFERYNLAPLDCNIRWRNIELQNGTVVIIVGKTKDAMDNIHKCGWGKSEARIRETGKVAGYPPCCIDRYVKDFYSVTKKDRKDFGDNAASVVAFFRYLDQTREMGLPYLELDKYDMVSYRVFLPSFVFVKQGVATDRDELFTMQHVPCKPYCPATLRLAFQYVFWKNHVGRVFDDFLSGEQDNWRDFNPEII